MTKEQFAQLYASLKQLSSNHRTWFPNLSEPYGPLPHVTVPREQLQKFRDDFVIISDFLSIALDIDAVRSDPMAVLEVIAHRKAQRTETAKRLWAMRARLKQSMGFYCKGSDKEAKERTTWGVGQALGVCAVCDNTVGLCGDSMIAYKHEYRPNRRTA